MIISPSSPRALLWGCFLAVTAMMTVFHFLLVMRGTVDQWSLLLLVSAALVLAATRRALQRAFRAQPAAHLALHIGAYLLVAGSIAVHAMVVGDRAGEMSGLMWMVACWGVGLLVHALSTVATYLPRESHS